MCDFSPPSFFHMGALLTLALSRPPTRHQPCHQGGDDGRLPLADMSQKRENHPVTSHSKDNAWQRKHGAKEATSWMKGGGGDFRT